MPAKDKYHDEVVHALERDGWTITHDPLFIKAGGKEFFIDLGAERLVAAEKDGEQIAIEIKSFIHKSFLTAFYEAIGKFISYREALEEEQPHRILFLAVPFEAYESDIEDEKIILKILRSQRAKLLIYNPDSKTIEKWINY